MKRLHDQILRTITRELTNIHTTVVARITKVNRSEGTIACQPVINRVVNGESVPLPEFPDVPVITLQGGKHYISFPVLEDDYCLLFVSERCFDSWYEGIDHTEPSDPRMFDYSDCFALVGVNPRGKVLPISEDNEILIISEAGEYIKIVDSDRFEVHGVNSKVNLTGSSYVNIEGNNSVSIGGNSNVNIEGKAIIVVKGDADIDVTGNTTTKVGGNQTSTIEGNLDATVSGSTKVECTDVEIGEGAMQSVIQSERFKAVFDTHVHTGNMGAPTSPPQVPLPTSTFSTQVKTGG